jgi:hypothetical protein
MALNRGKYSHGIVGWGDDLTMISPVGVLQKIRNGKTMADDNQDLLKGTLDMLILQALEREPMHGWGIAERIEILSRV